ncbi:FAD/NAD(P)-binding protein [Xinfangfangia sp. CPCC 101601]|uniref:FAD/NAD(P)-binding protein n=1 Tax=Pseudogemmobacter lacusdianii TaxID=3069608 RepID=A0ABU0W2E5_9RHOB|nr:FAD/NAD(P)-binding protein [Xinfangfangia sp. CPCC 101601]MDQ2067600.1 FAD/NAD(P)-binding protein [Xinfangfangia sp. CPCC 101601]
MRIAIVGTGPTGIYTLKNLLGKNAQGYHPQDRGSLVDVTLYEQGDRVGVGMPYSPETASRTMLANIASIEIPHVTSSYYDWMLLQSDAYLRSYQLDPRAVDQRTFTPRLMLGDYFHDQVVELIEAARAMGHRITVHENCRVTDLATEGDQIRLTAAQPQAAGLFDRVILATGHIFEEDKDLTDHYFPNPWSGLIDADVPAAKVGIMGTSLSAIDAAMAVATQHGSFHQDGDELRFDLNAEAQDKLMLVLMSWSGILPEADFYCPLPYRPLKVMTETALQEATQGPDPFEAVFKLFKAEIIAADPAWAKRINLAKLSAEGFEKAYFHDRAVHDTFGWARHNLAEVIANHEAKKTVEWRYAILRMHESVEEIVSEFDEAQRNRFDKTLKKVFVDNYAAVPPESIRRLLALRDAGVLGVLSLGDDYEMEHGPDRTVILANGRKHIFDVFIDARGQRPMESKDLPFPTLRDALLKAGQQEPQIGEDYGLMDLPGYEDRVYLAALPYLMQDKPFVQGITASAEIGAEIARAEARKRPRRRRAA